MLSFCTITGFDCVVYKYIMKLKIYEKVDTSFLKGGGTIGKLLLKSIPLLAYDPYFNPRRRCSYSPPADAGVGLRIE
ncbi:hypothetical protein AWM70_06630 [Paenibacillus yonginensis]|uniref:Uncharacterized protein n=1 Tax=Paenibacillus yonginensis TaxID=1462996 RepID=A0A1B1MYS3_9BACL|nr:hypothetical protein AWM70_06630 [Paenibacillus yonginensis]